MLVFTAKRHIPIYAYIHEFVYSNCVFTYLESRRRLELAHYVVLMNKEGMATETVSHGVISSANLVSTVNPSFRFSGVDPARDLLCDDGGSRRYR